MAGSEINQNRKKHMKSLVLVPEETGMEFADVGCEQYHLESARSILYEYRSR